MPSPGEQEVQASTVQTAMSDIQALLQSAPLPRDQQLFALEQQKDPEIVAFLEKDELPSDEKRTCCIALQSPLFALVDGVLFFLDSKEEHRKRVVVPQHLREQLLQETHSSPMGGHFAGKMYGSLVRHWWWDCMYADTQVCTCLSIVCYSQWWGQTLLATTASHSRETIFPNCGGRHHGTSLYRPRELLHLGVPRFFLSKWPLCPMPDEKSSRIAKILVRDVVPLF